MNMQATTTTSFDGMIKSEMQNVTALNQARVKAVLSNAKDVLDKLFPLAEGSHKDVCNYVVYFQHLLVFFKDGSKTGLKDPKQFVALSGHKSEPDSIVLNNAGYHLEMIFDAQGEQGHLDCADINDIHIQTQLLGEGDSRYQWMSLIKGCRFDRDESFRVKKEFTDKNGEDYILN